MKCTDVNIISIILEKSSKMVPMLWSDQDARMASNDDGIEWQVNTFDAVIDINMYQIFAIFASFEIAWNAL